MLIVIEIVALVAAVVLGIFWIEDSTRYYDPWAFLCGLIFISTELYRRIAQRNTKSSKVMSRGELLAWLQEKGPAKPLSEVLLRTLQLSQVIKDAGFEHWVRMEYYGYTADGGMTEGDNVPEYRTIAGRYVDVHNNVLHLQDPNLSFVNSYRIRLGVPQLEELAQKTEMQNIQDPGCLQIIRENLGIDVYRFCFSPVEVVGVLQNIRGRILDKVGAIP